MQTAKLSRLVVQNIRRNFGHFSMSAIGIIIGIASLSFFVGLRNGVKRWIHSEDILPLNKIEIIPPKSNLEIPLAQQKYVLNDEVVAKMRARPEVKDAYAKMKFAFPGLARGGKSLFGQDIQIEFIGDGIDPKLVADEPIKEPMEFKDFWIENNPKKECRFDDECPGDRICNENTHACAECDNDRECGKGKRCDPVSRMCLPILRCWPEDPHLRNQDGTYVKDEYGEKREKRSKHQDCWINGGHLSCDSKSHKCTNTCEDDADCGRYHYCDKGVTNTCYRAVPALVSRYLIEMYNGNIAPGRNWKKITDFVASQFFGFTMTAAIGDSVIGSGRKNVRVRKIQLVGISRKAIPLGVTVPLGYVKRWNRAFARRDPKTGRIQKGEVAKFKAYSSVVVWLRSKSDVTSFVHFCKRMGFAQADSNAEMVGQFIDFVGLLLGIVSMVILLISAINIAHTYGMIISERRREIGLMRAVGADRWDIRILFIGEATVLGLLGGTLGITIGRSLGLLVDFISKEFVAEFMFKPKTYFDFSWWVWVGAIGFAVLFCLMGTIFPANRAARMEPAHALATR